MEKVLKKAIVVVAVLIIATAIFGNNRASAAGQLNYRLKWLFNASVVGDIYADVGGFFTKKNLNVNVKPGGPELDAIRELELGHAQFGVASADQVIRAYGKRSPIVVIAQLFQVNPLHWIYRSKNIRIDRLSDLKGKIIGITYGGNDENIMQTLLAKANISEGEYTPFSVRYDLTPFYQKKADIWPCYLNTQGVILKEKLGNEGEAVAFFNPAEYGVKFVANSVITSARMLQKDPDNVKKFTAALMEGWRESLDPANETKVLEVLKQADKNTDPRIQKMQLVATRKLIQPTPDFKIGTIDVDAWKQTEQIMLNQKQIPKPVHVEKILKSFPELNR